MAINKNHEFDELDGVKCAIVEKNAASDRVAFLKDLLEYNGFEVVVVPSPPAKPVPGTEGSTESPETFTVCVTNLAFNPINAVFGRLLKTRNGHVVTPAYWHQEETVSHDEVPYFETKQRLLVL